MSLYSTVGLYTCEQLICYELLGTNTSIYMITSVPCRAVLSVRCRMSGGAARPLTSHVTKGRADCGGTVISHEVRGGAVSPQSLEQRTARSKASGKQQW